MVKRLGVHITSGAGPFDLCLSLSITLKQVLQGAATLVIFLKRRCLAEMLGANLNNLIKQNLKLEYLTKLLLSVANL